MEIDYHNLEYDDDDSVIFTYQHLSEPLKLTLSAEDVAYMLDLKFHYMAENGFVLDEEEDEPQDSAHILDMEVLSTYIQKKAMDEGIVYLTEQIDEVLEAEADYMKSVGIINEDDNKTSNDDVIDLGSIISN
jgi:hypothetical protein